jgi:hypothetical protein
LAVAVAVGKEVVVVVVGEVVNLTWVEQAAVSNANHLRHKQTGRVQKRPNYRSQFYVQGVVHPSECHFQRLNLHFSIIHRC